MTDIEQIRASIERRLADLAEEVASLTAARAALIEQAAAAANGAAPTPPAASPATPRARRGRKAPAAPAPTAPARSPRARTTPGRTAPARPAAARPAAARPAPARPAPARRGPGGARKPAAPLSRQQAESILRETGGLSAAALARRAGTNVAGVKDALDALAASGLAQSSGAGRGSVWRLLTDEERIQARAAELEAQLAAVHASRAARARRS
jgi:hypothetical protein